MPAPAGQIQWFEETSARRRRCFTPASSQRWRQLRRGPIGGSEADRLRRFFSTRWFLRRPPPPAPDAPLATWLQAHEDELRHNPYLREKNEVLANLLLPLFERNLKTGRPSAT